MNKICPFHPLAGHLGIFPFKLPSLSEDGWAFPWPVVRDPIFEIDLRLRQTRSGGAGGELFAKSVEGSGLPLCSGVDHQTIQKLETTCSS